jgi:hypothetical protein
MFKWLQKKAGEQSLKNVRIVTETLILVSNEADENIKITGMPDEWHTKKVVSTQESLLADMKLAIANDMSVEQVERAVEEAKAKYNLSKGAEMAIENVFRYLK